MLYTIDLEIYSIYIVLFMSYSYVMLYIYIYYIILYYIIYIHIHVWYTPLPHCKVAVMLREGDTSPTDIPKCLGGRQDLEAGRSRGSK